MPDSALKPICIPENLVRSTYYSDTYRSTFNVGGVMQPWDVTHISIPFEPRRERYLQERYGITDDGLIPFYEHLANERIPCELQLFRAIHDKQDEKLSNNVIRYIFTDRTNKESRGSDVYMVSEPLDPLIGSEFIGENSVSLLNLLQLAARFTQIMKLLVPVHIHIGAFSFDEICLAKTPDGKNLLQLGSLLYGAAAGMSEMSPLETMPYTADESVRAGGVQSIATDLRALCGMLWSVLDEKHYSAKPDFSHPPKNSPPALTEAMTAAMQAQGDDEDALKALNNQIHLCIRAVKKGEFEDITIQFASPEIVWSATEEDASAQGYDEMPKQAEAAPEVSGGSEVQQMEITQEEPEVPEQKFTLLWEPVIAGIDIDGEEDIDSPPVTEKKKHSVKNLLLIISCFFLLSVSVLFTIAKLGIIDIPLPFSQNGSGNQQNVPEQRKTQEDSLPEPTQAPEIQKDNDAGSSELKPKATAEPGLSSKTETEVEEPKETEQPDTIEGQSQQSEAPTQSKTPSPQPSNVPQAGQPKTENQATSSNPSSPTDAQQPNAEPETTPNTDTGADGIVIERELPPSGAIDGIIIEGG